MSAEILKFGPNDGPVLPRSEGPQKSPNFKFERPDWTLFRSVGTLSQKAGVPAARLRRLVLKELTDNALDAGATVQVSDDECDRGVIYSVRDYGPGVPAEALPRIFDPFYRVDSDRNRGSGGVGLGLAIARRSVELHKGKLTARNANPGLLVAIELPLAPESRKVEQKTATPVSAA